MRAAYLCDGLRTPIGRFGGALASVRPDDLAATVIRALVARYPMLGCANQAGEDNRNVARMASLLAGLPVSVPGTTINRLCASGMDAIGTAARAIAAGEIEFAIAGGVESMSRAPFVMPKPEAAFQRRAEIYDTTIGWRFIHPQMKATYGVDSMPETGENVAAEHNISRTDQDAFALRSQQRAGRAKESGFFAEEITPVLVHDREVTDDEHPRPDTTLEALAKLKPVVRPDGTRCSEALRPRSKGAHSRYGDGRCPAARHGDWSRSCHPEASRSPATLAQRFRFHRA
jgi:3-oxoadipyl-CoA thiolase